VILKFQMTYTQISNKFQNQNFNDQNVFRLKFEISAIGTYLEFGFWDLEFLIFGISAFGSS